MEIFLTSNSTSLVAVDKNSSSRLDLTKLQQELIIKKIKEKCASCDICKGPTRISNTGFVYETPTQPVSKSCPAEGETVIV